VKLQKNSKSLQPNELKQKCQRIFSNRGNNEDRQFWKHLDDCIPDCGCERVKVSPFSLGRIESQEKLVTAITNPNYVIKDTGEVEVTFFDQRLGSGLSGDRLDHTDAVSFDKRINDLVKSDPDKRKTYEGVIVFSVQKLRSILDKNNRCFAVYDTATQENPSHSEVVQTNHPQNIPRKERTRLRANIRKRIVETLAYKGCVISSQEVFQN